MLEDDVALFRRQVKILNRRLQRELPTMYGLSFTTLQLLVTVAIAPTPIRPGQLATELEMTNSNVAAALRQLEAKGYVVRRDDPEDGRKAFIDMTDLGHKVVADSRGGQYAWLRETIERLLTRKEQQTLLQAGDLMQRLAESSPPPVPAATSSGRRKRAEAGG